jgi:hypothetical protein
MSQQDWKESAYFNYCLHSPIIQSCGDSMQVAQHQPVCSLEPSCISFMTDMLVVSLQAKARVEERQDLW